MTERQLSPCQELRSLVTAYLDQVMASEEREWFESHLTMCGSCEMHLHEFRVFVATLHDIGPEPIALATRQQLHAVFQSWRSQSKR
jgi:predicted anti-sigma-YlaC factor YlaD